MLFAVSGILFIANAILGIIIAMFLYGQQFGPKSLVDELAYYGFCVLLPFLIGAILVFRRLRRVWRILAIVCFVAVSLVALFFWNPIFFFLIMLILIIGYPAAVILLIMAYADYREAKKKRV